MGNLALIYGSRTDGGFAPSGGSWQTVLPLANLRRNGRKGVDVRRVARAVNNDAASLTFTQYPVSIPAGVAGVVIANHNMVLGGTATVTFLRNSAQVTQQIITVPSTGFRGSFGALVTLASLADEIRMSFAVASGTTVPLEIGRFFVGDVFQPEIDLDYGDLDMRLLRRAENSNSETGVVFANGEPAYRSTALQFKDLSEIEATGAAYRIAKTVAPDDDVFLIQNVNDTPAMKAVRSFHGTMRDLLPIKPVNFDSYSWGFTVDELT